MLVPERTMVMPPRPPSVADTTSDAVPQEVGPYQILGTIGAGGMGTVYRARDPRLQRDVALKVLHPAPDDGSRRLQRFLQEARTAGTLNHPNVVAVYDVGTGVPPYIVCELIDGVSLRQQIQRGPMPLVQLLDTAAQIADGLTAAHQAGLVHQDLKPANVMITRAGRVKIVDFGLAQPVTSTEVDLAEANTLTALHVIVGTPGYMSPEQARGGAVDFRSDVFSFGAILYEMATGRRPFDRPTPIETLTAILHEDPRPIGESNTRIPPPLESIIQRCLAKSPEARYAATADLLHDLRSLRDRLATRRSDADWTAHAPASPARRLIKGLTIAASGAAVALTGFVALAPGGADLGTYRYVPLAAESAYEGSPAWSPDGRTVAYIAERDGIMQVITRGIDASSPVPITHAGADCRQPFWSRDGKRLFYISLAGDRESLWSVASVTGGTPRPVFGVGVAVSAVTLSPDGSTLVFLREEGGPAGFVQSLWMSAPAGAEPRRFAAEWGRTVSGISYLEFSPDGSKVALWADSTSLVPVGAQRGAPGAHEEVEMWVFDFPSGRARQVLASLGPVTRAHPFAWMRDSRHVVFGADLLGRSPGTHLWIGDIETGDIQPLTMNPTSEYEPDVSPDGRWIAFTSDASHYDVLEIPIDGSPLHAKLSSLRDEADPTWSPTRPHFAYVTDRSGVPEIWLSAADGSLEQPIVTARSFADGDTFLMSRPAFSWDGARLAYQRRNREGYAIWVSPRAGGSAAQLIPRDIATYQDSPTWSPDGEWVAFAYLSHDGRWRLGKVPSGGGSDIVTIREDINFPASPQWSPDGRWIAIDLKDGLYVVSPDGAHERLISGELWLAHAWSRDGSRIFAIRQSEEERLQLVSIDVRAPGKPTILVGDLGPSPPTTPQLRGFSPSPDGKSLLTSIARLRGDVWLLGGFEAPGGFLQRMRRAFWRRPPRAGTFP